MCRTAFICILLLTCYLKLSAETITFDIYVFKIKIGQTVITHQVQADGTEKYIADTHAKAKILWINKTVDIHSETVYKDGKLISAVYKEDNDGKPKRWNTITLTGTTYTNDSYKGKSTFTQAPTFSVGLVFFKDLHPYNRIFDEAEGVFVDFMHTDTNTWEFKSNGTRSVYFVTNGQVQNAEFHTILAAVKIVREK